MHIVILRELAYYKEYGTIYTLRLTKDGVVDTENFGRVRNIVSWSRIGETDEDKWYKGAHGLTG